MVADKPSLEGLRIDRAENERSAKGRGRWWIVLLAVAVLYNLAALILGEGGASDTVAAPPEGPTTIPP